MSNAEELDAAEKERQDQVCRNCNRRSCGDRRVPHEDDSDKESEDDIIK